MWSDCRFRHSPNHDHQAGKVIVVVTRPTILPENRFGGESDQWPETRWGSLPSNMRFYRLLNWLSMKTTCPLFLLRLLILCGQGPGSQIDAADNSQTMRHEETYQFVLPASSSLCSWLYGPDWRRRLQREGWATDSIPESSDSLNTVKWVLNVY